MFPHREPQFHADWWSVERLVPILLLLVVLAVVVWAVVRFTTQPRAVPVGGVDTWPDTSAPPIAADPALELIRQRYARGEVDRDAFLQTLRDLMPSGSEPDDTAPPPSDGS